MISDQTATKKERQPASNGIFFGWYIVVVAGLGLFVSYGPMVVYTFGVFLKPASQDIGWNRTQISLALSLSLAAMSVSSLVVGRLLDKFGARKVILAGALILGLALFSFDFLPPKPLLFYGAYIVIGAAGSATGLVAYLSVVSRWFDRRRGLALGLAMIGVGLGSLVMPPASQALISILGWRRAYALFGLTLMAVTLTLSTFLKERPEAVGLLADGETWGPDNEERRRGDLRQLTGRQALQMRAFWIMCAGFFLVAVSVSGCLAHLVPMLTDHGMAARAAVLAASLLGGATLLGRVVTGYLLDRFFAPHVAACYFCGAGLGLLLLWTGLAGAAVFIASFLIGLANGAEGDIIAYQVGRYFGLRAIGEVFSYVFAAYVLGGVIGPFAMGVGFDATGSYTVGLSLLLAATLAGALLMMTLGPYTVEER